MDNISFHHFTAVKGTWVRDRSEIISFPAYFPFFNHIENCFSQWKSKIAKKDSKTEDDLIYSIHQFQDIMSIQDCNEYFKLICSNCLLGCRVFDNN